jgi:hypothetical protein
MVEAMEWVSKITTVALEMVLPGLAGTWLDRRWGTNYLAIVGFALGLGLGLWHLLVLTGSGKEDGSKQPKTEKDEGKGKS